MLQVATIRMFNVGGWSSHSSVASASVNAESFPLVATAMPVVVVVVVVVLVALVSLKVRYASMRCSSRECNSHCLLDRRGIGNHRLPSVTPPTTVDGATTLYARSTMDGGEVRKRTSERARLQ